MIINQIKEHIGKEVEVMVLRIGSYFSRTVSIEGEIKSFTERHLVLAPLKGKRSEWEKGKKEKLIHWARILSIYIKEYEGDVK